MNRRWPDRVEVAGLLTARGAAVDFLRRQPDSRARKRGSTSFCGSDLVSRPCQKIAGLLRSCRRRSMSRQLARP